MQIRHGSVILPRALVASLAACSAKPAKIIELPGDRAYPESIAAADGTLYVCSLASGGIWRIMPGRKLLCIGLNQRKRALVRGKTLRPMPSSPGVRKTSERDFGSVANN